MCAVAKRRVLGSCLMLCAGWFAAAPAGVAQTTRPKLDVPYVPTDMAVVEAMLKLGEVSDKDYVFDLGCGDGRIVITAAQKYKARGFGVDIDPQRIAESNANAAKAGVADRVKFQVADIMVSDVHEASAVMLFLLQSVNIRLRPNLLAELKPGARVVSHTFDMGDWKPDKSMRHRKAFGGSVYYWVIPAGAGGVWTWKTKLGDKELPGTLRLEQDFQAVAGAVRLGGAPEARIEEAALCGTKLRFACTSRVGSADVKIAYEGTVEGDAINGTQKWTGGPSAGTWPWAATRSRPDVAGRWQIAGDGEGGAAAGVLTIASKDGRPRATFASAAHPRDDQPVPQFYVWGAAIHFETLANGLPAVYKGLLAAGDGRGTLTRDGQKDVPWTAKRLPAK